MSTMVVVTENGRGRYQQEVIVGGRHHLIADEPESVGGSDAGPAPFDFLMAGLGACTAMTLRMYAERKGLPLTRIRVTITHDKVEGNGKMLDRLERTVTLEGDLTSEERQRCLEIANKCPLHRALQQPLVVDTVLAD